jgi:hypothetical protein
MSNRRTAYFKFDSFAGILLLVMFFVALFFVLSGIFWVLKYVAPVLLVAAFIIDKSVVIGYGKWLLETLKNNPIIGIGAILLTILGYTVVFPFLFAKALFKKKIKKVTKQFEEQAGASRGFTRPKEEFVDYEEVSSETHDEKPLELPRIEKQPRTQKRDSEYDQFFE